MHIDLKDLFDLQSTDYDPQIVLAILENVKEGSQEGFDYLKFRYSLINLLKMNMDIATSIKSAFMTASTMGLNKDKLLASLAYYEGLIQKQKEDFTITLRSQILKNVDAPKAELQKLDHLKEENMRKIAALQREIDGIDGKNSPCPPPDFVADELNSLNYQFGLYTSFSNTNPKQLRIVQCQCI
jgi:hypothetical protein